MRTTFEEACAIPGPTANDFVSLGVPAAMEAYRSRLAVTGWTLSELCEESASRMHKKIETLMAEEGAACKNGE